MQTNRITVFIVCLVYLVALGFLLNAIGEDIPINYSTTTQGIGQTVTFFGMTFGVQNNFLGHVLVSVDGIPDSVNTIFIVIPFGLMVVFGIMMWIPTIPSG